MKPKMIMFLGFVSAAGTMISLTFGGDWLGATDLEIANSLTVFKEANIVGVWTITVPNVDFFFTGIKSMMMLDFAFFIGPLQLIQWLMMFTIVLGIMWGLYMVIITTATSALRR